MYISWLIERDNLKKEDRRTIVQHGLNKYNYDCLKKKRSILAIAAHILGQKFKMWYRCLWRFNAKTCLLECFEDT